MANTNKNEAASNSAEKGSKVKAVQPKEEKKRWTMARCRKVANRFSSESEWAKGAPSSYKSAQAHGWTQEIVSGFKSKGSKPEKSAVKKAA
ncbi:MAG: hypothetical protein ACKN9V_02125 [Pseudomonadota bacterium]